jgi:hypothetical protein
VILHPSESFVPFFNFKDCEEKKFQVNFIAVKEAEVPKDNEITVIFFILDRGAFQSGALS